MPAHKLDQEHWAPPPLIAAEHRNPDQVLVALASEEGEIESMLTCVTESWLWSSDNAGVPHHRS